MRFKFLLLYFLCNQAVAQSKFDLQKCIELAIQNNIQLKQSALQINQSAINFNQSKLALLPSLNADANHLYNFGRNIDPTTNIFTTSQIQSNSFNLNTTINLFSGFQEQNQIGAYNKELKVAKFELEKASNDLAINVASAYLKVLFCGEQLKITQSQKLITLEQKQRTEKLITAGNLAAMAMNDVQAQLANDELNIITAQNNLDLAVLQLKQLIQVNPTTDIYLDTTLNVDLANKQFLPNSFNLYLESKERQPNLLANKMKVLVTEQNYKIRKGALMPSLSLFGTIRSNYSSAFKQPNLNNNPPTLDRISFENQIDRNFGQAVGLSLSVPIFNAYNGRANMQRSGLAIINAKYNLAQAELQLQNDVYLAIANVKAATSKYIATQASANAMQAAFDANNKKLMAGLINSLEYNTSKTNLIKAQIDQLSAKYDLVFKQKIVDFYLGKPLY
jgi:outer membrane protein